MVEEYPEIVRCGALEHARKTGGVFSLFYNNLRTRGISKYEGTGMIFATGVSVADSGNVCTTCPANLLGVCVEDTTKGPNVSGISRIVDLNSALANVAGIIFDHLLIVHPSYRVPSELGAELEENWIAYQKKSFVWLRERFESSRAPNSRRT